MESEKEYLEYLGKTEDIGPFAVTPRQAGLPELNWVLITIDFGRFEGLRGWTWKAWAVLLPEGNDTNGPLVELRTNNGTVIQWEVWLQRLYPPDGQGYAQIRWTPQGGIERSIHNPASRHDVLRLYQGLEVWIRHWKKGRPVGTGTFRTAEEFRQAVARAVERLERSGYLPTQENVAEHLGCDARQIREWCARFSVSWKELKELTED